MEFLKKKFGKVALLLIIIGLGGFLRFYKLSEIPGGFYVDESAIGYNAYSLLLTGKDEYGKAFPIFLRSYGTFPSPLYTYLTTIPIKIWGPTEFSVRFLSAISGIVLILVVYLILGQLNIFKNKAIPLIATFLFAIIPWSIFFSRGAYEANLAFLLTLISVYFLTRSEKNPFFLIIAFALASFSTWAYQAQRLIVYVLLPGFLFLHLGKRIRDYFSKEVVLAVLVFLVIQAPQVLLLRSPAFSLRASGLFYKEALVEQSQKIPLPRYLSIPLSFSREFFAQGISYFSPRNLFWEGDADSQRGAPELPPFYSWMAIPYLAGLLVFLSRLREKRIKLILLLMVSFVLPASLTKDPFSTLRALPLSFPLLVVISLGIDFFFSVKNKKLSYMILIFFVLTSFVYLWRSHFVLLPKERARLWGYGYKQLVKKIEESPETHFVIDQERTKPLYIQFLFFTKFPPEEYQKLVDPSIKNNYYVYGDTDGVSSFANLEARNIEWETDIYKEQILVGDELAVSESQQKEHFLTEVFEIRDPIGYIVFVGYKTNPARKCAATGNFSLYCKNHR